MLRLWQLTHGSLPEHLILLCRHWVQLQARSDQMLDGGLFRRGKRTTGVPSHALAVRRLLGGGRLSPSVCSIVGTSASTPSSRPGLGLVPHVPRGEMDGQTASAKGLQMRIPA